MLDVIIIGAGLAGLNAAKTLQEAGKCVTVLESADRPGGRIGTEQIQGYLIDHGFALLNPAYPAAKKSLNLKNLDLHAWARGVTLAGAPELTGSADPVTVAMPLRHPRHTVSSLKFASPKDLALLAKIASRPGPGTIADALDRAQLSPLVDRTVRRFLAGVTGSLELDSPAAFGASLLRYFLKGTPTIPAQGMAAIPAQLLKHLENPSPAPVRYHHHVTMLKPEADGVTVTFIKSQAQDASSPLRGTSAQHTVPAGQPETLKAKYVIVAAGPVTTARLLGQNPPQMNAIQTWWVGMNEPVSTGKFLTLDLDPQSPLVHAAPISNVSPSYAPAGKHLLALTAVGDAQVDQDEVFARATQLYGLPVSVTEEWELLAHQVIDEALPVVTNDGIESNLPRVFTAGDSAHASIQGALDSGRKTAKLVLKYR
ncbi:hypothetical protein BSR28_01705 [Boudabousia liubingyangii]|uniref:NAD(P)/FAD-dependent oxidoreductase n=1 Tax=Boudabousia liubingyangii TaxID=1921764 RepID=UPI00093C9882|nr:NAD(P)/FAD-dependent oxidoreductase [Boudabousia liubingyangii]OKL48443.1 hypothetical protein BSR28_01705 [Boudabousia liubingyangii]